MESVFIKKLHLQPALTGSDPGRKMYQKHLIHIKKGEKRLGEPEEKMNRLF